MIFYDMDSNVPDGVVADFVREQALGRLVTGGADGTPHAGRRPRERPWH